MVITIGREYGSGGKYIGERLAKDLNFKLYDKELLNKVSEDAGIDLDILEQIDEKQEQSFWYSFAMSLYSSADAGIDSLAEVPSNEKIFIEQSKAIEELADKEDCIIIGRCSNVILRDKPNVLNVFVYSSELDFKINRKMKYGENSESEIEIIRTIERTDKERATYYNYFTKEVWGDRKGYDLMIDTSKTGVEGTIELIKKYVEIRKNK